MGSQAMSAFTLCTLDGAEVTLKPDGARRCQLLLEFSPWSSRQCPTECNVPLSVPFYEHELLSWMDAWSDDRNRSLAGCASAVKVADFLRDESTINTATKAFGRLLLDAAGAQSGAANNEAGVSEADAHILLSLGPQLAARAMREVGSLATCLHRLPRSCHSIAVAAAISDSSALTLDTGYDHSGRRFSCNDYLEGISSALRDLPSHVRSLRVCLLSDGDWVERLLTTMPQLRCLEVIDSSCSVPARAALQNLLPALTRLRLSCSAETGLDLRDRFTSRLGKLTLLKELEYDTSFCHDRRLLLSQLKQLTSLTHLSLSMANDWHETTSAFQSMAVCTSLESLSLGCSGASSSSVSSMLVHLPHVTALALNHIWHHPVIFHHSLLQMTHLLALDLRGMHGWNIQTYNTADLPFGHDDFDEDLMFAPQISDRVYFALQDMPHLLRFHAWKPGGEFEDYAGHTDILMLSLPATLTELDLQGNDMRGYLGLNQLNMFTNLHRLSLEGCLLPVCCHYPSIFPPSLRSLNASGCNMSYCVTMRILRVLPEHLTELDMSGSDLYMWELVADQLQRLTALQCLSLGACLFSTVPGNLFECRGDVRPFHQLPQLRSLRLEGVVWKHVWTVEQPAHAAQLTHLTKVEFAPDRVAPDQLALARQHFEGICQRAC